jgi:hypothetical protein
VDQQGLVTLVAGSLLILISFFTNYSYGDLQQLGSLAHDEQIGVALHVAALAALFGDVELATRLRHRAANQTAGDREQTARRDRVQARCLVAQSRFLLADTPGNRLRLHEAIAALTEQLSSLDPA